jgi:ankyrin repeat protein
VKKVGKILLNIIVVLIVISSIANYFSMTRAIRDNDIRIVKLLLKMGVDVNSPDRIVFWTPLHSAAVHGNKEISELLISNGAKLDAKDKNGYTPLDVALIDNHDEVASLLIEKGASIDNCTLNSAAYKGKKAIVDQLIKKGLNVNSSCASSYFSPLVSAINNAHDEVVELLIDHGAIINPKEKNRYTPLHAAASHHNERTVRLLINKGAKINATDEQGHTPLYYATKNEEINIQRILIIAGAIRK